MGSEIVDCCRGGHETPSLLTDATCSECCSSLPGHLIAGHVYYGDEPESTIGDEEEDEDTSLASDMTSSCVGSVIDAHNAAMASSLQFMSRSPHAMAASMAHPVPLEPTALIGPPTFLGQATCLVREH